jgi:hypothetical protein
MRKENVKVLQVERWNVVLMLISRTDKVALLALKAPHWNDF